MAQQLSAGVQVNEIDLTIIVPMLGNSTACFAGVFTKGPSDKFLLCTNTEEYTSNYGYPTNANYNDWYMGYNFLQYANKLLVSRAVDTNGTFSASGNTVTTVNELGKVEVANIPSTIQVGSIVKFDANSMDEYKVSGIETNVTFAIRQKDSIKIDQAQDGDYSILVKNAAGVTLSQVVYTANVSVLGETVADIANGLGALIEGIDTTATNVVVNGDTIEVSASIAGIPFFYTVQAGAMTLSNVIANTSPDSYELVFETDVSGNAIDFTTIAVSGAVVLIKDSALNAIACATIDGGITKNAADLKAESIFVSNENDYEIKEMSIPVYGDDRLKFIAKSSGAEMNGVEIAIARESDFATGTAAVFKGIPLNDLFEVKPSESKKEIAVIVRKDEKITGLYVVSTIPGSKDYRNKSNYIEDVINKYDSLVYVKDNTALTALPASKLYVNATQTTPAVNNVLILSNGSDGMVNFGDIQTAYGSVADGTIFGNKEEVDIDIVIANEQARVQAGLLASERKDCIAFIGAKFEDVVGLSSSKIVENLIKDVMTGELNSAGTANSFCAFFGNYKYQYDKFNDKFRWISVAGDVAGLRADTNTSLNTWWASAGLDRGQIKNAQKIAFNPNNGQRDMLYKNKINPIVSFPGQGNAVVWGQKTLNSKPSAFDRINVRGLFNTLERSISRMAKYYLFEFNDVFTRNRFTATIKPFLESVKAGRGVYDFEVRCDETNNTPQVIDSNGFVADIAVKPTRVAEFITLNFMAVGTGVDFNEIFA